MITFPIITIPIITFLEMTFSIAQAALWINNNDNDTLSA